MRSSTFSFEFRLAAFAVFFAGFVALAACVNRTLVDCSGNGGNLSRHAFFLRKVRPGSNEIVVYGDSRTYHGIVPEILSNALGRTCMNYAFSSGGMNDEMMRFLNARLRHTETASGIVILGVTPLSLSVSSRVNQQYHEMLELYARDGDPDAKDGVQSSDFIRAYPLNRILDRRVQKAEEEGGAESSDLGWRAFPLPANWKSRHARTLKSYRSKFSATQASDTSLDELVRWVAAWTKRGVRVYLFRVPTCREMVELEDRMSGCDMVRVARRLAAVGGRWLEFDAAGYESRDGSHLSVFGAKNLSRDLADRIAGSLDSREL